MFSKKVVNVGNIKIGGENPLVIQSMTNTDTKDVLSTINQINNLSNAGAQIVRLSVRDLEDIEPLKKIIKNVKIPLIADIHFNYKVAIESIKAGISKIRINPGNIDKEDKIKEIVKYAKEYKVPIRVGSNSGSISKKFLNSSPEKALAESALEQVKLLEKFEFEDIFISAKSSDAIQTFKAYKYIKEKVDYPLHIGITEAGIYEDSLILSSAGIGALLLNDIGDTIRISITGDPIKEVISANKLLTLLGLKKGIRVISCPTCARTEINIEELVKKVKELTNNIQTNKNINIAVMGCIVNGPGEAKHSDIAIAGSRQTAAIYQKGKFYKNVKKDELENELINLLNNYKWE